MRLTEKKENGFYELKEEQKIYGLENGIRLIQMVGKYEDIEEELGIDLITLIRALKNGVWVKTKNDISKHLTVALKKRHHTKEYWLFYRPYSHIYLKDYGKTWALTKEELL